MDKAASKPTKLCPTCGTRVPEDAHRCLVCGTDLTSETTSRPPKAVQGSRIPAVTLSLPAVLGLLILFLAAGAAMVYFALRQSQGAAGAALIAPSDTPTVTTTLTATPSPTMAAPTATGTPEPSPTPQTYEVKTGDLCGSIAALYQVSVLSIIQLNDLKADCTDLRIGQQLLIPAPTATPTELPTATLSAAEATEAACEKYAYVVQESDTLGGIAANFNVAKEVISEYNGLVNDLVQAGRTIQIPLCRRNATPGPTPTPTPPPPYPAPNLLLPSDGAAYIQPNEIITLQWAAVGTLRENEFYAVTIEDITSGGDRRLVDYVANNTYNVPDSIRPNDSSPHVIRWTVLTVRQVGTDREGEPIYDVAGAASDPRVFTWVGGGGSQPEATRAP